MKQFLCCFYFGSIAQDLSNQYEGGHFVIELKVCKFQQLIRKYEFIYLKIWELSVSRIVPKESQYSIVQTEAERR